MRQLISGGGIPSDLISLLAHVTAPLGELSSVLTQQAMAATIVRASPTMLDVSVPADIPAVELADGPTPGQALVYDGDQLRGEILVWVRDGRLIGLEQSWYTDEAPLSWPDPEQVVVA